MYHLKWSICKIVKCIPTYVTLTRCSQAVASMDDALRVFYGGSASDKTLVPNLKHPRQKNISCVKWRPLSASGLAVAAQDGVVLWKVGLNLDPILLICL